MSNCTTKIWIGWKYIRKCRNTYNILLPIQNTKQNVCNIFNKIHKSKKVNTEENLNITINKKQLKYAVEAYDEWIINK